MEIVIKRDVFLPFKGSPPIPTPNYGVTLNWTNKIVLGSGVNRGWILLYQKNEWNSSDYKLIMKLRPGMIKPIGRLPWSCQSLMTYIKNYNR